MAHVCSFGAGDVTSAVAAGVSKVAARTLGKTWKLMTTETREKWERRRSSKVNSFMMTEKSREIEISGCYL